ncbi:hypothetical protein [Roseibium aggregatum]|uniref:Uncharacterized protein n=1 Tax=Roseibium aggregatum TaxID=187304 RepID=A0A926P5X9_9HYPH|nr:hypothetical protein [Roseibium aggregatum]MBD1548741.1 hypothetical protein [Roseibium aggregatum]
MFEGWTLFDYALLAWIVTAFILFTFAGLLQMPENEKRMAEAAKQKGTSKPRLMIPGRLYITSTKYGILGGLSFVMFTSGFATFLWRQSGGQGDMLPVIVFYLFAAYGLWHLVRAIRARMNGKTG